MLQYLVVVKVDDTIDVVLYKSSSCKCKSLVILSQVRLKSHVQSPQSHGCLCNVFFHC